MIIYLAGYGEMRFFAQATAGEISTNTRNYSTEGNALTDPPVAILALNDVEIFKNPVAIASIKNRLEFVPKNTIKWGCVLQRGAKRISEADANLIIREANKPPLVVGVGT